MSAKILGIFPKFQKKGPDVLSSPTYIYIYIYIYRYILDIIDIIGIDSHLLWKYVFAKVKLSLQQKETLLASNEIEETDKSILL